MVTGPSYKDFGNPATKPLVEKYLSSRADVSTENRLRLFQLIRRLTASDEAGVLEVLAVHAEGSLEAQKMMIYAEAPMEHTRSSPARPRALQGLKGPDVAAGLTKSMESTSLRGTRIWETPWSSISRKSIVHSCSAAIARVGFNFRARAMRLRLSCCPSLPGMFTSFDTYNRNLKSFARTALADEIKEQVDPGRASGRKARKAGQLQILFQEKPFSAEVLKRGLCPGDESVKAT